MLLFVESMLWSIIGESGFVVSSVVPSAPALLSFHMPTGKLGLRPLTPHALQDAFFMQPTVLVGLIAHLTGLSLPDAIATTARRLQQLGRDML
jgi:hypothetical protein